MTDEEGNWIEVFRSQSYDTRQEAENKINAVINFYVNENGWKLNGIPDIEQTFEGKYVAIIPLKKPAEKGKSR